jgi:hypothetical protein
MTCTSKPQVDNKLNDTISIFLKQYGLSGLNQALQLYKDTQQEYICRTKTSISKLHISDIYYMKNTRTSDYHLYPTWHIS